MNNNFLKECLKFNRENMDHTFSTIEKYQEYSEKIGQHLFSFPETEQFNLKGNEFLDQWKNMYKEGQQNIKQIMDETFKNIEKLI